MHNRESLKDLPGVAVLVEDFRRSAEDAGFDREVFQTDVELKLRMAGIRATEEDGWPKLYLNVNAMHRERGQLAPYTVSLELLQVALLHSPLGPNQDEATVGALAVRTTLAVTWSTGSLGLGDVADVRRVVKDRVDTFVNDWLSVNPLNGTG